MGIESKIEWTEATWNPWHGCHKVSAGCKNCYMFREKKHYGQDPNVVVRSKTKFYDPLKWKEPRTIFTCSWSDFFIEEADPWRDEAFAIMALTPQHTYQVLTKRPERMLEYFQKKTRAWTDQGISEAAEQLIDDRFHDFHDQGLFKPHLQEAGWLWDDARPIYTGKIPLPNVWLGVSVEDQETADERIQYLIQTPATIRWLSVEPLLGPVDLMRVSNTLPPWNEVANVLRRSPGIDWVVVGGESGAGARPMHPNWVRSIRDQCQSAGVPFFFKQWGHWVDPDNLRALGNVRSPDKLDIDGVKMFGMGKKQAGRLLDRRKWNEMPEAS